MSSSESLLHSTHGAIKSAENTNHARIEQRALADAFRVAEIATVDTQRFHNAISRTRRIGHVIAWIGSRESNGRGSRS